MDSKARCLHLLVLGDHQLIGWSVLYGVGYIDYVATRKEPTGDNCCHFSNLDISAQMNKMVIDSYQDFYISTTQTIGISSGYVY